jgi:hypothetical protein
MTLTRPKFALFAARPRTIAMVAAMLGLALLSLPLFAQESARAGKGTKTIEIKGVDRTPAMTINFSRSLGLPFDSLVTLGSRIEQATKASDPVCLAGLAKELSIYEQVSGKTAGITSDALYKEAVALAEARSISAELKAVALYATDDETSRKLGDLARGAERREKEARRASESGERTRGIRGNLIVHNNTQYQIFVFVDGRQLGWVNPYDNYSYFVGAPPYQNSVITGRSSDGTRTWGPYAVDSVDPNFNYTFN